MIVKHFKRKEKEHAESTYYLYKVLHMGVKHTETDERLVILECLYDSNDGCIHRGDIVARPQEQFLSKVDKEKYPDAECEYRFEEYPRPVTHPV